MGMYNEDKKQKFENAKIESARAHFAVSSNTTLAYDVVSDFAQLLVRVCS